MALPNLVAISPRSFSSCSTKAEDDNESATPITTASSTERMAASCGDALNTCMLHQMALCVWWAGLRNMKAP